MVILPSDKYALEMRWRAFLVARDLAVETGLGDPFCLLWVVFQVEEESIGHF